jgi:CRP-like cAMP-binding protein
MDTRTNGQLKRHPSDRIAILQAHPFFKGLDSEIVQELAPRAVTRALRKGGVLFRKGDQGTCFYVILSGSMRVEAPSAAGRVAVFNFIFPGEIFGELAAFDAGPRTADAVAMEKTELLVIDRREILPLLRKYPNLALRFIEILAGRIRRTSEQVEDIVFLDLAGRLAKALLYLGRNAAPKSSTGKVRVTQREISQLVGASRESTNKQLREWERQKMLRIERGGVVLLERDRLAEETLES